MSPFDDTFWDAVERIRDHDDRFRREAYGFVLAALSATVVGLPESRRNDPERRHLSGQELVQGVVSLARSEFGPLASTVFEEWGVRTSSDIGAIVFQLVEEGQLFTRPEDRREDFDAGPDLLGALRESVRPAAREAPRDPGPGDPA
ncbi:MAG: hypothetical protein HOP12_07240 [Candidatus Eisenbacteria bacterium]|uniref:Uncharacterized protein n=1 Tax=Eiseniibacteriota bacterium TaxID=2212470 RepID=A0A849SXU1_UNCEI|nr:hypothetical protein [Candidatus Eisenbacteria bacterium]